MEEPFTFEEIALQRIFDLKNEVVREFESHQSLYSEALISICFLKGITPPPSLVVDSGAAVKTLQKKDSINSFSLNGRFSEAYGGYFYTKRCSSSVDRPACYQVAAKRCRLQKNLEGFEENGDGGRQIAGDEPVVGKGHCVDAQKEGNGGMLDLPHAFVDGFEELEKQEERESGGDDNCRVGGRTLAKENLLNVHMDRSDEKREEGGGEEEEKEDVNVVHKGGRVGGRGRGRGRGRVVAKEKEKKNDVAAALPVVGRITRSKARQCQISLSAEKETGKRKAMESKEQLQPVRMTCTRRKLQAEVEVPEEPMDVAATVSPSACPKMAVSLQTGGRGSSSPLPYPVIAVLSQTGGSDKSSLLPSSVIAVLSQKRGNEDTETPFSHDVLQQTSICRSSSFNKYAGKQSAEMELETSQSAAALHVSCQIFPGVMEDPSIHSVKTGAIEGSYDNKIELAWSDWVPVTNTPNHGMGECQEGSLIPQKGRPTSSMDMSVKVPSEDEEDMTSQMVEVTEFVAEKHDKSSLSPLKSGVFPEKVGASDSGLRSFSQVEAVMRQREIMCDTPRNTPTDLKDGIPSIRGKSFSRNMVPLKEDEALKLQNKSWPGYQKQRSLAQEEVSSARKPRLLRSESCSKAFEYNTSVQGASLDGVGLNDLVENNDQRHVDMLIFSPKDFSCPKEGSLDAFPDQQNASFLSSEMRRDENLTTKDIECRRMARFLLKEQFMREKLSMKMGYPRLSCLTDLAEQKCPSSNEVFSRNLPSYTSYAKIKEGSSSCTGLPRFQVDGMSSNCTSVSYLPDKTHLHATPSKSHSFGSSFEMTSPQDRRQQGDSKVVPSDDAISEFSFQKVLDGMDTCDMKRTPSLKKNVVTELGQCGLSKSVAVNKKSSNQFGLESHEVFTGGNISDLAPGKKSPSLEADCQCEVNTSSNGFAKGVVEIPEMQGLTESCYRFSSTRNAVDSTGYDNPFPSTRLGPFHDIEMSQEFKRSSHDFSSKDRNFCLGKTNAMAEKGIECQTFAGGKDSLVKRDMEATEFYNALRSFTPAPNQMSKCRKYIPSGARWTHLYTDSSDHSENSIECWGRGYASEIDYSGSLTPAGGMLFDRTVINSMDTDSNLFVKQVQMNREHTGCFPIEEESLVEEESMDHHTTTNKLGKGFGSLTKNSVLSTKNILTDCSPAKQNSLLTTPPDGRFCESVSTNSMDRRPNLFKKQALVSPKYFNSSNLEEQARGKENINELQKRYVSSVRKKDSRTPNLRAGSSFASQASPRISQKPSNILCNVKSFIPLVQQKQAAASIMTGKRDIKVKALEAAEVAKRLEEKREQERKMRKELARRGEHEKKFLEKSKEELYKGEKEGEESSIACSDSNKSISSGMARKKPVGCTLQKSHADSSSQAGTSANGVDFKLRRAFEAKTKLEQDKLRKLEEKKQKEEERKKNAAEIAANKRKKEEMDKRDREEKRKRLEEAQKQQKELEEQLRAEKEAKEQRRRALDEYERKRKAMEEKAKKQRRIEKEKEAAERRRRIEEDAKSNKFASKDAKHMEEIHQYNETTLQAQKAYAGKVSSMSTSCTKCTHETEGQSMLGGYANSHESSKSNINIESYEISPYSGSDEEDNDDDAPSGKLIPLWARKENLIPHIISQQYIDPDEIFPGARTCSLNEVFESNGSNRRRDFKRRSYSGEWLNDCFTWKEEYQYKLQMGYINKG